MPNKIIIPPTKNTIITKNQNFISDIQQSSLNSPIKRPLPKINLQTKSDEKTVSNRQTKPIEPVAKKYDFEKQISQKQKRKFGPKLFYAFGVSVFILSFGLNIYSFVINRQAKDEVSEVAAATSSVDEQGVQQGTGSDPSSDKPNQNAFNNYRVAPDRPRYLRVPTKSINARVKELGLAGDGSVDAPWNVHDVGWYNGSIVPGSKNGVSLFLGHISGRTMPGVFKDIANLSAGDIIEVEKGNGEVLKYQVDKVEQYDIDSIDMAKILYEVDQGHQSLRLMTCSGKYDSKTESYGSRAVVYASPVK
ncbi:class F sortase [Candidatus Saccharibacteria bacterium]|nr:class F sortase [Candidatus Saccharibacteria bacterium]